MAACEGPRRTLYPYGNTFIDGACNEGRSTNPVIEIYGPNATFSWDEMNDPQLDLLPNTVSAGGAFTECVSSAEVYDLNGNLDEWVLDLTPSGHGIFKGGYFVDATINGDGCTYTTTAHSPSYHDYSLGFRCCSSPQQSDSSSKTSTPQGSLLAGCPTDMVPVQNMFGDTVCMDLYEAPNTPLYRPLVMYDYDEAQSWCQYRNKRLCFEDEWTSGCAGPMGYAYPYGNTHIPAKCNDNQVWRLYNQTILNYYMDGWSTPDVESVEELMRKIQLTHTQETALLVDHLEWLYQGWLTFEYFFSSFELNYFYFQGNYASSPPFNGCVSAYGARDTQGNVEEWTTRRVPGGDLFHGNLKVKIQC